MHRKESLNFFIYNVLPGTTSAAGVKAKFLKEIIVGESVVEEITPPSAFEQLSHMKGGPSVEVLIDLALGNDNSIAADAAKVLKCHPPHFHTGLIFSLREIFKFFKFYLQN